MQQIKDMAAERTHMERELNELKAAAQVIVDMINPPEEGDAQEKTLVERLQGAPQSIMKYVSHVLGLQVKPIALRI